MRCVNPARVWGGPAGFRYPVHHVCLHISYGMAAPQVRKGVGIALFLWTESLKQMSNSESSPQNQRQHNPILQSSRMGLIPTWKAEHPNLIGFFVNSQAESSSKTRWDLYLKLGNLQKPLEMIHFIPRYRIAGPWTFLTKPQSLEVFQQWQFGSPSWQSFMHCLESCTTPTNLALIFIMSWSCSHGHSNISSCMNIYEIYTELIGLSPCTRKMSLTIHRWWWSLITCWFGVDLWQPLCFDVGWKDGTWNTLFFDWQDPGITIHIWGLPQKANDKN